MAAKKLRAKPIGGTPQGDRVRAARNALQLSQDEMAERSGLLREEISNCETGRNQLTSAPIWVGLAKGFGVSLDAMAALIQGDIDAETFVGIVRAPPSVTRADLPTARLAAMLGAFVQRFGFEPGDEAFFAGERGRELDDLPLVIRRAIMGVAVVMEQPVEACALAARSTLAEIQGAELTAEQWFALIKLKLPPRPPSGTHMVVKKPRQAK